MKNFYCSLFSVRTIPKSVVNILQHPVRNVSYRVKEYLPCPTADIRVKHGRY